MKKFLLGALIALFILPFSAYAENDIKVMVNSEYVDFDTPPVIKNGRTLLPVRAVAEKMGLKVTWDQETSTASVISGDKTVKLTIGSNILKANKTEHIMDVSPEIINDRTCLPLRAVVEAFGAEVDWDGEKQLVTINAPDTNKLINYSGTFLSDRLSYFYSDELFNDTDKLNYNLAQLSAVAMLSAQNKDYISEFFEKCGFYDIETHNYENIPTTDEYTHTSIFTLARKKIGEKDVVALIINGTSGKEWYSNFDISENEKDENIHYGFKTASEEIIKALQKYADKDSLIWCCGHSRGGAVANIVAKSLADKKIKHCAYTFAAPNVVKEKHADKKVNIYNFISNDDIITKIPPSEPEWNYSRHGKSIVLDEYDETDMNEKFFELTGRNYNKIRSEDVQSAENLISSLAKNVDEYYNLKHGDYTPYEFFTKSLAPVLTGESFGSVIKSLFDENYGYLMRFFLLHSSGEFAQKYSDFITVEAYDDCNGIIYEHCMESYLCKIYFTEK